MPSEMFYTEQQGVGSSVKIPSVKAGFRAQASCLFCDFASGTFQVFGVAFKPRECKSRRSEECDTAI